MLPKKFGQSDIIANGWSGWPLGVCVGEAGALKYSKRSIQRILAGHGITTRDWSEIPPNIGLEYKTPKSLETLEKEENDLE